MAHIVPKKKFRTSNIQPTSRKSPSISIIGVNKVLDPSHNWFSRVVWLIILLTAATLCLCQLYEGFVVYFKRPIVKQTDRIFNTHVKYPAIYVCPSIIHNRSSCLSIEPYEKTVLEWFPPFNKSADLHIWTERFYKGFNSAINLYTACTDVHKGCGASGVELKVERMPVHTFWGTCILLNTTQEVEYRGPFTYLTLHFKNDLYERFISQLKDENESNKWDAHEIKNSIEKHKPGLLISLSKEFSTSYNDRHGIFFQSFEVLQGYETHIQLTKGKLKLINRKELRCGGSLESSVHCFNSCFEKNASKICRLPYIKDDTIKNCSWSKDLLTAMLDNMKAYGNFNYTECNCRMTCNHTIHSMIADIVGPLVNRSHIKIKFYFSDPMYDYTYEKHSYDFRSFLSDVGGNLGFCLGCCSLTIVEFIECLIINVINALRKKVKGWV